MKPKVAFATTIFPMEKSFLIDFFTSLESQTYKDFDVVVLNDQYGSLDGFRGDFPNLNIIEVNYSSSIAKNREYLIKYIKENSYDVLIFGDSDDYFSSCRVEKTLKFLCEYEIVVNDINLFNRDGVYSLGYFSHRLTDASQISIDYIKDKNIFGMSNSALNLKTLNEFSFESELVAVDWYLFSLLLLNKSNRAVFTSEVITFYRQYDDNTVGIKNITEESFKEGIKVKESHYKALSKIDSSYEYLLSSTINLKSEVLSQDNLKQLNSNGNYPLWWEQIKKIGD